MYVCGYMFLQKSLKKIWLVLKSSLCHRLVCSNIYFRGHTNIQDSSFQADYARGSG